MTTPRPDPDDVDRTAAENDVADAEVVDLDAARSRRTGITPLDDPNGADLDLDDTGADEPVMVDSIAAQRRPRFSLAAFRDAERVNIIPSWLRSTTEFGKNAAWAAGFGAHTLTFHSVRLPVYAVKLTARAPRGFGRVCKGYNRWLWDLEGEPVRQSVVRAAINKPEEAKTYDRLTNKRDRRVRWRGLITMFLAIMLTVAIGALMLAPVIAQYTCLVVLVAVLGYLGTSADKPLLGTAVVRHDAAPLTSVEVFTALAALNIKGINDAIRRGDDGRRWFPAPIQRETGVGWRAEVELPRGVTASTVVGKREELAAALTRPLGCVWPEANADVHPGRLILFVADKDMSRAKQKPFPLLKSGTVNLFKAVPFGTDPRGTLVTITLMYASMIIGALPRFGKTFALRLALLLACLDPRSWILAFDLKGTGDLSPLEPVSHAYRAGDDEEDIEYVVTALREIHTEMRRRTKVIRDLPRDLCPENKVTDELASNRKLGLHPIAIGIDECQRGFEHPKYGAEIEEICEDLIRRGPAVGIFLLLATQRPDAKSLPTGISANAVLRFCLKVMGQTENDMVLGTSMYRNGIRATMFSRRDKGIGYLAGEGDEPVIVKTFEIDGPAAEAIVARARTARERYGNLTGHAAGVVLDTTAVRRDTILEDVAAVMTDAEAKLWSTVIVKRLAVLRGDAYAGFTADQLREALKPWGVRTGQVWGSDPDTGETGNRKGITRAHVLDALTKRDRDAGGSGRK
ncbi:cell division protein FtsK [Couchioplanes caeruleus]|uniref:Cell division protein FtsK n=2 Tax=Couchioplanes caeruleus TaxID=56438 RepID=A0A1K0FS44_9ACTN|nr:cell division protein FtsK [Couchioplanes caeruleus]OJF15520.1 cell division protein FtsK [Couchioplanes caeruleus subsp. caeruleus]ROP30941.1 S-DNA-T family DNA segregation ATPase FtsK/SpoIIIE [Couchioplanes caeruleus]